MVEQSGTSECLNRMMKEEGRFLFWSIINFKIHQCKVCHTKGHNIIEGKVCVVGSFCLASFSCLYSFLFIVTSSIPTLSLFQ